MSAADNRAWAKLARAAAETLELDLSDDTRHILQRISLASLSRSADYLTPLDTDAIRYAEGLPDDADDGAPVHETAPTAAELRARTSAEAAEKRRAWREMPRWERKRRLLDALGDERMTTSALARKLNRTPGASFSGEYTRILARELVEAGELVEAKATGGRCRFVYSRQTELSGPIADLEAAFHEAGEAA